MDHGNLVLRSFSFCASSFDFVTMDEVGVNFPKNFPSQMWGTLILMSS